MQTLILAFAAKAMSILTLVFLSALLTYNIFINLRSRYSIKVNCWFCNENTRVSYTDRNCWTCPACEQYNGFNADGDYNCDILAQRDCSIPNESNLFKGSNSYSANELSTQLPVVSNGLCDQCNEAQRLKIEMLAQFEPKNESRFNQEIKIFQSELEKRFCLCCSCERHVSKVLHEKKKVVLGSKLLNFIMKGAALIKQPYLERVAIAKQQRRVSRFRFWMSLLTWVNILFLLCSLPAATREQFCNLLGKSLAYPLYFVYSHALTLLRLVFDSVRDLLTEQACMAKFLMFANTFGKLVFYSVNVGQQNSFCSFYTSLYPYAMLALSLICNVRDGLKFTRFTLLLVLWSVYANGSQRLLNAIDAFTFILLGSVLSLILLTGKRSNWMEWRAKNESTSESFHRLLTDECISDNETISMLTQQLSFNASNCGQIFSKNLPNRAASIFINDDNRNQNNSSTHISPTLLSLDSLRLSSKHTPVSDMPLSQAHSCHPKAPLNAASNFNHQPLYNNEGMHMDAVQMDQSWQPSRCDFPRKTTNLINFPLSQCPRKRSANNLLLPSRLRTQEQHNQRNGDICAWVNATSSSQHPDLLQDPPIVNVMNCCYNREVSPTHSQSSGFESQMDNNQARHEPTSLHRFLGLLQNHQEQPSNMTSENVYSGLEPSQRQLRIPAPLLSTNSTPSEMHFGRTTDAQSQADLLPGDLLRKWMGRNSVDIQKR